MDAIIGGTNLNALTIFIVATFLYVFASFTEAAIGFLNRARVQRLAERQPRIARTIYNFVDRPADYLTVSNLIRIGSLIALTMAFIHLSYAPGFGGSVAGWATLTIGSIIIGIIVPRAYATVVPEHVAIAFGRPLVIVSWLLSPLARLVMSATSRLSRWLSGVEAPDGPAVTTEELKVMVAASEEEGLIERRERTMIDNILELEDVAVREVMVPRPDIVAFDVSTTIRNAAQVLKSERYSRYPLYHQTIDEITGILYAKDMFQGLLDRKLDEPVGSLFRPAYFVPESKKCDQLLRELQQQRVHIAIVVDEYGGTAGLVTIEDLLEEIVGEIQDEFDAEEQKIVHEPDGSVLVDALASIDDVNDALSLDLAATEVDTVGGLVYERLGRVPDVGDEVRVGPAVLTVVGVRGRRVTRVRVRREPESSNGVGSKVGEAEDD